MQKSFSTKDKILETMSDLLSDICDSNLEDKDNNPILIKAFLSKKKPSIPLREYLGRLVKYTGMEESTLVLILIYIDRIHDMNSIRFNYFNIHKLLLGSLIIGIKYNEDTFFKNSFYALVGGVSNSEMDRLEYEFLSLIEFKLYVDEMLYNQYYQYLIDVSLDSSGSD